ncbi:MAG: copper resistance protein NlpE [Treponema sp.]|jgi:uncharacterized lipoprotein NlpE involved in copper resistance|nr:copper resistance protein NlpE [Treponema sp.]
MKKNLCIAVAAFLLLGFFSCGTTSHNARNSLDWAGVYTGVIPSAGGEGIDVKITLTTDETYTIAYQYIGKSDDVYTSTGTFSWKPDGNTIILDSEQEDGFPPYYKLGENTLTHLDLEGNIITGELADDYILKKQQ